MKNMHVHGGNEEGGRIEQGGREVCDDSVDFMNWQEQVEQVDREMWFDKESRDNLLDVADGFISYDDFPPLPDFPCISSTSSSSSCSSAPPHPLVSAKPGSSSSCTSTSSSSSSSAASWTIVKQNFGDGEDLNLKRYNQYRQEEDGFFVGGEAEQALLSSASTGFPHVDRMNSDCMHVMEELGDMDLFDTDDIWDPSTLFPDQEQDQLQDDQLMVQQQDDQHKPSEDLAMMFFHWLKSNKECISADDLRKIKLKRSTVETAAEKLGGGKEGMKQLLKLILEWVQTHQLQKKKERCNMTATPTSTNPQPQQDMNFNIASTSLPPEIANPSPYFVPSMPQQWSPAPAMTPVYPQVGYLSDQATMFTNGVVAGVPINNVGYPQPDYSSWPPQSHFALPPHNLYNSYQEHHIPPAPRPPPTGPYNALPAQYPCQMYQPTSDRLTRMGSSATKEARKKRMARQKRLFTHSRNHNNQHHPNAAEQQQQARLATDVSCTTTHPNQGNWIFWCPSPGLPASPMMMPEAPPPPEPAPPPMPERPSGQAQQHQQAHQNHQRQVNVERRQGCKTGPEKNLKFLLQKVLKQSDVGNLGRIVLPKKEAETYLPELEARDGISIAMEDIGTSHVWNMRYRFWPNNKSRMYLLENTGDFVRSNGLQEGDFIVIYSDIKCGKYLIRGVKVRQAGSKSEARKNGKSHRYLHANPNAGTGSSSAAKETTT